MCEAQVLIKRDDGKYEPVSVPDWLARRAAIYRELMILGLSLEDIKFVVDAKLE